MMHRRVSKVFSPHSAGPDPVARSGAGRFRATSMFRRSFGNPFPIPTAILLVGAEPAVDLFDQGALANEMKNGAKPVTKWSGSIDIAVRGDAGRTWLARVGDSPGDLSHMTGRSITVDDNPLWAGDMDIYVTNRAAYWPVSVEPADGVKDQPFTCIALPLHAERRDTRIEDPHQCGRYVPRRSERLSAGRDLPKHGLLRRNAGPSSKPC